MFCDRCSQPIRVGEPVERTPTHSASAARPDTVVHEQCPRPGTPTIRSRPKGRKAAFLPHPVFAAPRAHVTVHDPHAEQTAAQRHPELENADGVEEAPVAPMPW